MRIRRYMAALLAMGLLLGLCPAAVTEDIGDEIASAAVELAVPEEEMALGGAPDAAPAAPADEAAVLAGEGDIAIDEVSFPDEVFRQFILDRIDDGDGTLTESERAAVTELIVWSSRTGYTNDLRIASLKGAELFPNLEKLDCTGLGLRSLDVKGFTKLKTLRCSVNDLTRLDVSENPALENLDCGNNSLSALDVSRNPALKSLDFDSLKIAGLDLSHNPELTRLHGERAAVSALNLTGCMKLEYVMLDYCRLTDLDLSGRSALEYLYVRGNDLTRLNVGGCVNLTTLYCHDNELTSLNVSGCVELRWLHCFGNRLSVLDVSDCGYVKRGVAAGPAKSQTSDGVRVDTYVAFFENWDQNVLKVDSTVKIVTEPEPTPAPVSLANAKITVKDQTYTGKALKPAVAVKLDGKALEAGADYTVEFSSNRKIGTATVKVTGTGGYTGTASAGFKINPKKVAGLSLKAGRRALTAAWKKASGVDGYELQYGAKKSFKGAKLVKVKKGKTVQYALEGLKSKRLYYVRIRAYKTVSGKTYYSDWSAAKSKKAK